MKKSAQYRKIVEWSEEDRCYVGRCPECLAVCTERTNRRFLLNLRCCHANDGWQARW